MKVWIALWYEEVMAVADSEALARERGTETCMDRFGCELTSVDEWEVLSGSASN